MIFFSHVNSLVIILCFSEFGQKPEYYVHVNVVTVYILMTQFDENDVDFTDARTQPNLTLTGDFGLTC